MSWARQNWIARLEKQLRGYDAVVGDTVAVSSFPELAPALG
jgi:hypothetical protein